MLVGCAAAQLPTVAPGTSAQTSAQAGRGTSWMLPEAKKDDLIYVSTDASSVYVYSYPAGKLVGTLTGFSGALYECVDGSGDVYITNVNGAQGVDEYAHGGSEPINVFQVPEAAGCSVDSTTGNLAVASNSDVLYVFPKGSDTPIEYTNSSIYFMTDVAYDGSGDLFIDGALRSTSFFLMELPEGRGNLENIGVPEALEYSSSFEPMLWDGTYLTVGSEALVRRGKYHPEQTVVNRLQISGSEATIVGTTDLALHSRSSRPQYWIHSSVALETSDAGNSSRLEYFTYPRGKKTKRISVGEGELWGTVLSSVSSPSTVKRTALERERVSIQR